MRGDVLLTIAALVWSPSVPGRADVFSLQLPVHTGDSVCIQGAAFLETWHCARIDASPVENMPGSFSQVNMEEDSSGYLLAWDDTGESLVPCGLWCSWHIVSLSLCPVARLQA